MTSPDLVVLTVPGYTGSEPEHWQSIWEREHPEYRRVEQADWDRPERDAWVQTLQDAIRRQDARVLLVAHSCGAATVVHWAARHGPGPVAAALLVAPPDANAPHALEAVRTFAPLPLQRLPFPSALVTGDDDPHLTLARARQLARHWGSRLVVIPGGAHLNTESGHGPWPEGRALLAQLHREARASGR